MKAWLAIITVTLTGCALLPEREVDLTALPRKERSLGDGSKFLSAVSKAKGVKVYEGLPHQFWEKPIYERELARTDLIQIEGYSFYAKPLEISSEDKKILTALALRPEAHVKYSGFKMCGDFHPDYVVVWTDSDTTAGALICFGCHEWKIFTARGRLQEDLGESAYNEAKAILSKYVVNRPPNPLL